MTCQSCFHANPFQIRVVRYARAWDRVTRTMAWASRGHATPVASNCCVMSKTIAEEVPSAWEYQRAASKR